MADDVAMPNGNGDFHDAAMRIGVLSQRTTNLEGVVGDIRRELGTSISGVNSAINAMSSKFDERFTTLSQSMADRSRPQWQAMSVMLAALVVAGGLVYWPIREQQGDTKSALALVAEKMIPREELNWRSDRSKEDRVRTEMNLGDLRSTSVTRAEWSERNLSRDHDIENLRASVMRETTNLQRQVDNLTSSYNGIFNTRDVITDTRQRLDRLEGELAQVLRAVSSIPAARGGMGP